jgi:hypothetical protein
VRSDDEDETYVKGLEMTTEGEQAVLMGWGAQRPNAITMCTDMATWIQIRFTDQPTSCPWLRAITMYTDMD